MLGLVVIAFILAYLAISGLVVWLAARWAKRRKRRPWVWGGLAALVMYNLVFWDWIPTLVMHKYYCATEAGFWVYKTPEQWAKENPGVLETLEPWPASKIYGKEKVEFELNGGKVRQYNDRFGYWSKQAEMLHGLMLYRSESGIIDVKSRQFITRRVGISSGTGTFWKFWLNRDTCNENQARKDREIHREIINQLQVRE